MFDPRTAAVAAMTLCSGIAGGLIATLSDLNALGQSDRPLNGDAVRITDRQGRVRAGLGLSGGNQEFTYFYMLDRNGKQRVSFTVSDSAPPDVLLGQASGKSGDSARGNSSREAGQGAGPAASFAQVRGKLRGTLRRGGTRDQGDQADALQELAPPRGNLAQDLNVWLSTLNGSLQQIVRARFNSADMGLFTQAERAECRGSLYCQLAFRQNAIAIISGVR